LIFVRLSGTSDTKRRLSIMARTWLIQDISRLRLCMSIPH
jgi:hypothetical protein